MKNRLDPEQHLDTRHLTRQARSDWYRGCVDGRAALAATGGRWWGTLPVPDADESHAYKVAFAESVDEAAEEAFDAGRRADVWRGVR